MIAPSTACWFFAKLTANTLGSPPALIVWTSKLSADFNNVTALETWLTSTLDWTFCREVTKAWFITLESSNGLELIKEFEILLANSATKDALTWPGLLVETDK